MRTPFSHPKKTTPCIGKTALVSAGPGQLGIPLGLAEPARMRSKVRSCEMDRAVWEEENSGIGRVLRRRGRSHGEGLAAPERLGWIPLIRDL